MLRGNYPVQYGYITYTLKGTKSRFIDIFLRPKKDYEPTDTLYFIRLGFHEKKKIIAGSEQKKELIQRLERPD